MRREAKNQLFHWQLPLKRLHVRGLAWIEPWTRWVPARLFEPWTRNGLQNENEGRAHSPNNFGNRIDTLYLSLPPLCRWDLRLLGWSLVCLRLALWA